MKTVILAAGRGTRLRAVDPRVDFDLGLDPEQARVAESGIKALVPIHGRPFVDFQLEVLTESGLGPLCAVIGPDHQELGELLLARGVEIATQKQQLGTAHALLAAESFAGDDAFLVVNGDNFYPAGVLAALRTLEGSGLAAFDARALVDSDRSNVSAERIAGFALVESDRRGRLTRLVEKPDPATLSSWPHPRRVSMNCWRFSTAIFAACHRIDLSPRGELELTAAVQYAIDALGVTFRVVATEAPVLELSSRRDIPRLERLLRPTAAKIDLEAGAGGGPK